MEIGEYLASLCDKLREFFYASYGDSKDSGGGDLAVIDTGNWIQLCSISNPCIFYFRNLDPLQEVLLAWNDKLLGGARIPADSTTILDNVSGVVYVKPALAGTTVNVNYYLIAKKVNS